jgi:hypothetical protein
MFAQMVQGERVDLLHLLEPLHWNAQAAGTSSFIVTLLLGKRSRRTENGVRRGYVDLHFVR